jgi:transcriptional activator HAC1
MEYQQQSLPVDKFQHSPAESLMSIPGDSFTSLFDVTTPSAASTMNPMEMMTPKSFTEDHIPSSLPQIKQEEDMSTPSPSPAPEKRTTKKRKSWGQVLPEPKTNLPPRKRAKTEDEKEQRRVERVLRNRRAAQSSRERKRQEVEALEKRNQELEQAVRAAEQANAKLMMELEQIRRSGAVSYSPSVLDSFRVNPSLSQELFSSQHTHEPIDGLVSSNTTVDPTALSPVLSPVAESSEETTEQELSNEAKPELTESTSPDLTQRPAAMLSDLQCHKSAEMPKSFPAPPTSMPPTSAWHPPFQAMLLSALATLTFCQRPLAQIAMSLKTGISLHPTPQLLATIIWLVTLPRSTSTTTSTSACGSTTTAPCRQNLWQRATSPLRSRASSPRSTNLRIKSLRKILSSSPILARPLKDATLVALRLVSERCEDRVEVLRRGTEGSRGQDELTGYLTNMALPSRELLMTILWTIQSEERRLERDNGRALDPQTRSSSHSHQSTKKTVSPVISEVEDNWTES